MTLTQESDESLFYAFMLKVDSEGIYSSCIQNHIFSLICGTRSMFLLEACTYRSRQNLVILDSCNAKLFLLISAIKIFFFL